MAAPANVQSIDAIRDFRQHLKRYLESMRSVLDGLHLESNKALDWIEHERPSYWPRAAKQANDQLVAARNDLLRCKMAAMEGQRKSCHEEKDVVERWLRRLRHCEAQVKVVRHWRQRIRHEADGFSTKLARLSHYVENDIPKALAALDRMIAALDRYTQIEAPRPNEMRRSPAAESASPPTGSSPAEGLMDRRGPDDMQGLSSTEGPGA